MTQPIKWIGSGFILLAIAFRGAGYTDIDLVLSLLGAACWCYVGIQWRDRALIILNVAAVVFLSPKILLMITSALPFSTNISQVMGITL